MAGSSGNRIVRPTYGVDPWPGAACPGPTLTLDEFTLLSRSPRRSGSVALGSSFRFGMMEPPTLKTWRPDPLLTSFPESATLRRRMANELTLLPSVNGAAVSLPSLEAGVTPRERVRGR